MCRLLFSATIIIGCTKYERNAFVDAIQIDSSYERSTSLQSDGPVADDDDSSEDESVPSRILWRQGNSFDYTHEYEYFGPEHEIADVLKEPIDLFLLMSLWIYLFAKAIFIRHRAVQTNYLVLM